MTISERVCSGLSLNCSCKYIAEDMAWKVYALVGSLKLLINTVGANH